jgi:hypothetical protein
MIATAENIVLLTYFREADCIDLQFQTPGVFAVSGDVGLLRSGGNVTNESAAQLRRQPTNFDRLSLHRCPQPTRVSKLTLYRP